MLFYSFIQVLLVFLSYSLLLLLPLLLPLLFLLLLLVFFLLFFFYFFFFRSLFLKFSIFVLNSAACIRLQKGIGNERFRNKKKLEMPFGSAFEYDHDTPIAYMTSNKQTNEEKKKYSVIFKRLGSFDHHQFKHYLYDS